MLTMLGGLTDFRGEAAYKKSLTGHRHKIKFSLIHSKGSLRGQVVVVVPAAAEEHHCFPWLAKTGK